jgi:hypothetical protein
MTGSDWTRTDVTSGLTAARLYCFGVDFSTPINKPTAPPGARTAFLSSTAFVGLNGLDNADTVCANEASNRLKGTYKALLATTAAGAASRFSLDGGPWARPDGVLVVRYASDLANGRLLAPISANADGTQTMMTGVWTGSSGVNVPGGAVSTCSNWSTTDAAAMGAATGKATSSSASFWTYGTAPCALPLKLYCLEQ